MRPLKKYMESDKSDSVSLGFPNLKPIPIGCHSGCSSCPQEHSASEFDVGVLHRLYREVTFLKGLGRRRLGGRKSSSWPKCRFQMSKHWILGVFLGD